MYIHILIKMKKNSDNQICSECPQILEHRLRVPSFGLDSLEPAQMPSFICCIQLDLLVFFDTGEGHRGVAHDRIVLRQHHQCLYVQSIYFLIGNRVLIEDLLC